MIRLAACQYAIELHETWDAYADHLQGLCAEAVEAGARLLLLPEYAGLVLSGQLNAGQREDLKASIAGIQPLIEPWKALCESLARRWGIYLQPGSVPVLDNDGRYRNRAWLFGPQGVLGYQDKLMMTRFEREQWDIAAGQGLQVFETELGRLGILICYDNEFPMLARRLAERGVRFTQVFIRQWDQHGNLRGGHTANAREVDQPIAALIRDLKQRGLLDSTMVQWSSEFGRTPLGENRGGNKNATGRDHHPFCFSMLMAGGGFKGGHIYGKTDEIGWNVVEKPVHPNDLHATMLHCFGLDHEQLTYRFQGRDFRLTDVAGNVIKDWLA